MLPQAAWLGVLVWCACHLQDFPDLHAIVDGGRGDVPIKALRFRCTKYGSRRTDWVVMAKDAMRIMPWHRPVFGGSEMM
jgi:hypothetical protein